MRTLVSSLAVLLFLFVLAPAAGASTRFVALSGSDAGNDCSDAAHPCRTISQGIGALASGDTLIIGDGTYAEPISGMPSGTAGAYTTIRAANDWGVLIDGSAFPNTFQSGILVASKSYVLVRGFKVRMNQASDNNEPVMVVYSDHVKIQRCAGSYAPTTGNAATIDVGPDCSHVLIEESYAFGGARYQFLVYQSDHVIVRRSVARSDCWNGSLQCAGFVNYDSVTTAWQNNIVLDSDNANCSGSLYGGFFNENKTDFAPDTSQTLVGNIVLNVQAFYAGDLDWVTSGTRTITDMVIWGSSGGYWGDQGPGVTASISVTRMTAGGITGAYDGPNTGPAHGTGLSIYGPVTNTVTASAFVNNHSFGVADYARSDYNAFFGNGASYGGVHMPSPGAHDVTSVNPLTASLRYLPRIEPGSPLKTAGPGGGQIGAEILEQIGVSGTLQDEPGWDVPTGQPLWPFPNEDQIRADMAAYSGPGGKGARGFATGTSLDGTPQTLTKYIWEYLGNQIPPDVYGLHVISPPLPAGTTGRPYSGSLIADGGTPPYTWSVTGSLPPGLTLGALTGLVVGTPTAAGLASFTVTVTDAHAPAATASKAMSIVIADPPPPDAGVDAPRPDAPLADAPVVTPDAPVVSPDAPVVTPDAPVVSPDAAVVTPDAPGPSPDAPVATPDAPGPSADAPVATPDAPGPSPDAPTTGPGPEALQGGCRVAPGARSGGLQILFAMLLVVRLGRRERPAGRPPGSADT